MRGNVLPMTKARYQHRVYDREELIADGIIHGAAIVAVLYGGLFLLTRDTRIGTAQIAGLVVYLVALLCMLSFSMAYNLWPRSPVKWILRRFDHSAIYLMIAGTYTPLLLQLLNGALAAILGATVWIGALAGVCIKVMRPGRYDGIAIAAYLALGWVGVFAASSFMAVLPLATMVLIVIGGLLYSAGVPFYLWEKLRFQNAIWHVFVVAAAAAHFVAIALLYI